MIAILAYLISVCAYGEQKHAPWIFWEHARNSIVVLKGTVKSVNREVTLTVDSVFKGDIESEIIKFTAPEISKDIKVMTWFPPIAPSFMAGRQYIVFLNKNKAGEYVLVYASTDNLVAQVEQCLIDLKEYEALNNDVDKCKMLVKLMSPNKALRSSCATKEIYKFNKAEFFELFEPLLNDPIAKFSYVSLLGDNPNPKATERLVQLLNETKQELFLNRIVSALKSKKLEDINLSKEIFKYIKHESPQIRRNVIFVLKCRDFKDAIPEVSEYLEDENPEVRVTALYYLKNIQKDEEILEKIKKLRNDSDEHVRAAVYRALPLKVSSFYEFFRVSLLDSSRHVRRAAGRLDIIFERRPTIILLLLLWPSIAMSFIVFYVLKIYQGSKPGLTIIMGIVAGYVGGAFSGYLTGKYNSTVNPLVCAIFFIPPLFMPIGVLFSGAINKYGKIIPIGLLFLSTIILCVIIQRDTSSNTLWPSMLVGVLVMAGMVLLGDFYLKKISLRTNGVN